MPGPKRPDKELIDAVVEMTRRNSTWGCPRIAQQIALAFDVQIDKDVVRRTLAIHYLCFAKTSYASKRLILPADGGTVVGA